jgi:anti-sigma regulatory factor (Ser/Thr protein kinase)
VHDRLSGETILEPMKTAGEKTPMADMELELRMAADMAAVPRLVGQVEACAGALDVPLRVSNRLALIAEELASNIATHGTKADGGATFLKLRLRRQGSTLHVEIDDDGPPFDPLSLPRPDTAATLEARHLGGLGVHLVRTLARDIRYERLASGNHLALILDIESPYSNITDRTEEL